MPEQLMWNGRPVPWAARWSEEADTKTYYQLGPDGVRYADEHLLDRGSHGELWARESNRRGKGHPEFAHLSARRQRKAMKQGLCQVCGEKIEPPYIWLMSREHMKDMLSTRVTMNPPTCQVCVDIAKTHCPDLKSNGSTLLKVETFDIVGVFGEIAMKRENGEIFHQSRIMFHWGHPAMPFVLAKQSVVLLKNWEVIES